MRHGTYSIVARDPATGELGVAVQSHWFSVGPLCAWARAGVGAVATQSVVEPAYGPNALDRLAEGVGAQQALGELLAADPLAARPPGRGDRRRAASSPSTRARTASRTPATSTGEHWSCQANMMARDTVPEAMSAAFASAHGPLLGAAARRARGGRGRGRRRARAPVGGDGRRARRGRAVAADGRPARRGPRRPRSRSCAGCSRSSAPTTSPAPATSCWPRAAPTRPASSTGAPPSSRRARTSCCSGPASPARRPATSRAASPRSGGRPRRTRTGWSSSTGCHRSSRRPARPCVSRSPEGGTSVSGSRGLARSR